VQYSGDILRINKRNRTCQALACAEVQQNEKKEYNGVI